MCDVCAHRSPPLRIAQGMTAARTQFNEEAGVRSGVGDVTIAKRSAMTCGDSTNGMLPRGAQASRRRDRRRWRIRLDGPHAQSGSTAKDRHRDGSRGRPTRRRRATHLWCGRLTVPVEPEGV
jgi:hypothetical protein